MKHFLTPHGAAGLLLALGLLIAGCNVIPPPTTDSTRTYVLMGPLVDGTTTPSPKGLKVGLHEVQLAGYLNTRDMVVRSGTNEIQPQDYARWAEPLQDGVARLLKLQLSASPAIGRIYSQPVPFDADRDYDISVMILRCEGSVANSARPGARFAASVEISTPPPQSKVVARRLYVAPEAAWDGKSYGELASLLSADVAGLGQEIIGALPASP